MRVDALRDYDGWRAPVAEAVRLGAGSGEFSPAAGPDQVAMLTIALAGGAGIPWPSEIPAAPWTAPPAMS
jgi:hypothetical protein